MVDHSDSLGAKGRFGNGDVQWLTAGKGVQHAEMFPLLNEDSNPFEIFQIWLNLPAKSKKAEPYYKMLWSEDIPSIDEKDKNGKNIKLELIAGSYKNTSALPPNPDSWAADANNHFQIWMIKMDEKAVFKIPSIDEELTRSLYFYQGESFTIEDKTINENHFVELDPKQEVELMNGNREGFFIFLQSRPINEPIVQYGPFVANTKQELQETIQAYQQTQFGGWPWPESGPVHGKTMGRFSKLPDGKEVIK
jgi:redox-sensitive bicupin YhaK (pirin superfamily)